jgi:hypothetical protein
MDCDVRDFNSRSRGEWNRSSFSRPTDIIDVTTGEEKMRKASRAHDERAYAEGLVTEVNYLQIEYGRFEDYIDWLNSTWRPTMEAMKKAGLIIAYKVFRATPRSPDQPNIIFMITYENMAALDKGIELEAVAKKVIGSTKVQNKARVARNEYRKRLGSELIRELILK